MCEIVSKKVPDEDSPRVIVKALPQERHDVFEVEPLSAVIKTSITDRQQHIIVSTVSTGDSFPIDANELQSVFCPFLCAGSMRRPTALGLNPRAVRAASLLTPVTGFERVPAADAFFHHPKQPFGFSVIPERIDRLSCRLFPISFLGGQPPEPIRVGPHCESQLIRRHRLDSFPNLVDVRPWNELFEPLLYSLSIGTLHDGFRVGCLQKVVPCHPFRCELRFRGFPGFDPRVVSLRCDAFPPIQLLRGVCQFRPNFQRPSPHSLVLA